MADSIGAIGSGNSLMSQAMGQFGSMHDMSSVGQAAGLEKTQSARPSEDTSKIGAETNAINETDKTEISEEAQEEAGAANAAQQAAGQGQQVDMTQQIKDAVQRVVDEAKGASSVANASQAAQNGHGTQGAQTASPVDQLKEMMNAAQKNGVQIDESVSNAAQSAIDGDVNKADQIINGHDATSKPAEGLKEDQQVGKAQESSVQSLITNLKDMVNGQN